IGGTAENACPDADRESRPETTSTMRTRGYVLAHEERGLQVDWRLVRNADWVQSGGRDAVAGLLDDPDAPRPDAVMCLNDALAIGVIHELQRRGVRVPQDMQVIGFDNVPDAEYCMPGLTTIDPHVDDYARHAVDMLIARIEGSADPFRTYVTSYDLVRRASTC
ncbi:substrate-binding domain-containing protein, partial [Bifidobacterium longum]